MDPTNDPNFTPPSLKKDIEPTLPSYKIPKSKPIQPLVLADLGNAVDAPPPHPSTKSGRSTPAASIVDPSEYSSEIPKRHEELAGSSSSDEERTINPEKQRLILPPSVMVQSSQIADLEEVPQGIQRQAKTLDEYVFPTHRLATTLSDDSKYPLVIVACGSFSPITYLHLRMFEMALDAITEQTKFEVIGGYYSPVSSNYKKQGLASAHHRVRMCELACERTSSWLMVDAWESLQPKYTRTALVLDHFNEEINLKRGGIRTSTGEHRGVKIMLLAGGDLIESMGEPDVWADQDLHHILGKYGCLIVERTGTDVRSFLLSHDIMYQHRRNVLLIKQLIYNDISSTKIRLFIRRGMSVQYLLPNSVIRYIQEHKLYINETEPVKDVMNDKND
ncbi:Piso0_003445 [Millerozyma farinosa CBS 7064]|uniref:Nicotinamide-nucleotide adenylyltransferase n=1 Tax=Pichia sorbitophila (strain ATCC MYA-4447 / BCRC 22081 / CBS 7064 / NBRC 10061 / NRRL Y-12695) TaxID=559304 RepID=G8YI44_PICSO|nr:Piso0_003445 [Millerozyma farinosa CBS 7064]CCE81096.1 Piso0_003445 [Millerozyma farinosa CBS 7064]